MKNKLLPILAIIILTAIILTSCGGSSEPTYSAEDVTAGGEIFASTCSACHGPDAKGLPNLGKDLTTSEYVRDNNDETLLLLLVGGRPSGHELNTTGVDMPPRGGNSSLSDDDLRTVIAYLRSINQ
ncbi:MAG: c-type cytochrome [Chloroflexota bacterium]|nr:MAG: c-type cytochrome [Chloroflexota bacterium]